MVSRGAFALCNMQQYMNKPFYKQITRSRLKKMSAVLVTFASLDIAEGPGGTCFGACRSHNSCGIMWSSGFPPRRTCKMTCLNEYLNKLF